MTEEGCPFALVHLHLGSVTHVVMSDSMLLIVNITLLLLLLLLLVFILLFLKVYIV